MNKTPSPPPPPAFHPFAAHCPRQARLQSTAAQLVGNYVALYTGYPRVLYSTLHYGRACISWIYKYRKRASSRCNLVIVSAFHIAIATQSADKQEWQIFRMFRPILMP